ncbi:MAG TPA: hypothetical protein VOB72_21985 [Candidatus Dormibacteraeota bacterium]|nr:hypothetical protein [Candidatus Dormibacteraeota bacterium]
MTEPDYHVSPKAWMSIRDADLLEAILVRLGRRLGRSLRVVEWGAGRSTLSFTAALDAAGVGWRWLTLEHNRAYFERELEAALTARGAVVSRWDGHDPALAAGTDARLHAVVFDHGEALPGQPSGPTAEAVRMGDYVELPGRLWAGCDVALVDGRMRRRCLLEASRLVSSEGVVLLHDYHRTHYQCAFAAFRSHRVIGYELWIGAQRRTRFREVLPPGTQTYPFELVR